MTLDASSIEARCFSYLPGKMPQFCRGNYVLVPSHFIRNGVAQRIAESTLGRGFMKVPETSPGPPALSLLSRGTCQLRGLRRGPRAPCKAHEGLLSHRPEQSSVSLPFGVTSVDLRGIIYSP